MNKFNMQFLPSDYKAPKEPSIYTKFPKGETRLRILSEPIFGWIDEGGFDGPEKKALRFKMGNKPSKPLNPKKKIKHFWAFVVWNYTEYSLRALEEPNFNAIQVWEVKQSGIRDRIEELTKDEDWGSPFGYDIKVFRKGEALDSEYSLTPVSAKEIEHRIKDAFHDKPICLDHLFEGLYPDQDVNNRNRVKAFWEAGYVANDGLLTIEQLEEIHGMIGEDQALCSRILNYFKVDQFAKLPVTKWPELKNMIGTYSKQGHVKAGDVSNA